MLDASLPVVLGNVLWLDASDATTIFDADGDDAATGTGGNNDGFSGNVATWADKTASNFDVSAIGSAQPQYSINSLNGRNTITFDGINDRLYNGAAPINGNAYTAFVVFKRDAISGRDGIFEIADGASRNALFINNSGNKYDYYMNGGFFSSASTYINSQYELVAITQNSTSAEIHLDASLEASATTAMRVSTNSITVGDDVTGGDFLQGDIAELVIYNRALSSGERHDVENYLATKWGQTITNAAPVPTIVPPQAITEGSYDLLNIAMTDSDNTYNAWTYTLTALPVNGYVYNFNTSTVLGLGDTFRAYDMVLGDIEYHHGGSSTASDSFSYTVSDGYSSTAGTHNFSITQVNDAPIINGWTQVSFENFEGGATGWSDNTTTNGGVYLSEYLGRHSLEGGTQNTFKTYALSGTQDHITIDFDFYRIDSWDGEDFIIYIDDVAVYTQGMNGWNYPTDGSSGNTSWTIQKTSPFYVNYAHSGWGDENMHYQLKIATTASSVKLGFSSTLNQVVNDEAWGIDNLAINEVRPTGTPGNFKVSEIATNGEVFGQIYATDEDPGDSLTYSITGGSGNGIFAINPTTGVLTVVNSGALDFETTPSYTLDILVTDNGSPIKTDTATITIDILDVPENTAPTIAVMAPLSVNENSATGILLGTASAIDAEMDAITYSISGGNADGLFSINGSNGDITLIGSPNFEKISLYTLTIRATDNGFGNLSATRNVTININDVNEAPVFDPVQGILNTNLNILYSAATGNFYQLSSGTADFPTALSNASSQMLGGVAGHLVTITSAAENAFVTANIIGNTWMGATDSAIEGDWVWVTGPESGQQFWQGTGTGSAQNGLYSNWNSGEPNNSGGNEDGIQIRTNGTWNDINLGGGYQYMIEWEGASILAGLPTGIYTIAENSPLNTSLGFTAAYDPDAGDVQSYTVTGGTGAGIFSVNAATGEITLTNPASVNFEVTNNYTLDLLTTDSLGLTDTTTVTINILDANDSPTQINLSNASVMENSVTGTSVGFLSSIDEDAGDTHSYSLLSNPGNKFTIIGNEIQVSGSIDYEATQQITLLIRTDDANGGTYDQLITISIGDEADTFTPLPAPVGSGSGGNGSGVSYSLEKAKGEIVRGTIQGEEGQQNAYYHFGALFQIIRNQTTFHAKSLFSRLIGEAESEKDNLGEEKNSSQTDKIGKQEEVFYNHFTNIREVLNALDKFEKEEYPIKADQHGKIKSEETDEFFRSLQKEFVDVMTYHEQKQEKLRQVLLSG